MIAVLGYGGHGRDVAAIAQAAGHIVLPRDDDPTRAAYPTGVLNVSSSNEIVSGYLIGVNDPAERQRLDTTRVEPVNVIHPTAVIETDLRCEGGVVVGAGTVLGPGVVLGRHCHLNAHVFATRAVLGDYVTVGPGAVICGDVAIGARCRIGAGAVISNLVTLGPDVIIGAGAVVPPHSHLDAGTWVGVPVRKL